LHGRVAPWRPASGIVADGDSFFAWLAAVPEGEVSGSITVGGQTRAVRGSGYHDHNWGNISTAALMDG
ncbi:MAG: hydroxyneurosporene dehydrogenase, partial [Spirochaetota bacterium]